MINRHIPTKHQRLGELLCLWLATACDRPALTSTAPATQKSITGADRETAVAPSIRPVAPSSLKTTPDTANTVASHVEPSNSAPLGSEAKTESSTIGETVNLKSIVKPMLSRELFKLDPTRAQVYFANIAALQQQPSDESWQRTFKGTSKLPWLESVLIDLQEEDGQWRLGQSQITWRPPKAQARELYERLVTEVKAVRGRKPNFGRDESDGTKQQRFAGWTWCKDACEAIVALDSSGRMSLEQTSQIDEDRPAVLLQVYTPEGP